MPVTRFTARQTERAEEAQDRRRRFVAVVFEAMQDGVVCPRELRLLETLSVEVERDDAENVGAWSVVDGRLRVIAAELHTVEPTPWTAKLERRQRQDEARLADEHGWSLEAA